jgi:hypothetical protein
MLDSGPMQGRTWSSDPFLIENLCSPLVEEVKVGKIRITIKQKR